MKCPDCGEPLMCHCGNYVDGHGFEDGHSAVPVECYCVWEREQEQARLHAYHHGSPDDRHHAEIQRNLLQPLPPRNRGAASRYSSGVGPER